MRKRLVRSTVQGAAAIEFDHCRAEEPSRRGMRDANFERFDDLLGLSCSTEGTMFRYKGAHKSGRRLS